MMLATLPEFVPPQAVAANNLKGEVLAIRMVRLLGDNGIRAILLKGPAIRLWLYDDGTPRLYADIDLLVDPELLLAGESVLAGVGFEHPIDDPWDREGPWHAREWMKPGEEVRIELHRTVPGIGVQPTEAWQVLSKQTDPFPLRGAVVDALDLPTRAMHIALHAAQDGGRLGKGLDDLYRALDRVSFEQWSQALEVATRLKAVDSFAAGLRLDERGVRIAEELSLAPPSTAESLKMALRSTGGDPALALDWVVTRSRLRDKASALLKKVFPTPAFMRKKYPLARRGAAGLGMAYAKRLVRLVRILPMAVRAWRNGRTTSDE